MHAARMRTNGNCADLQLPANVASATRARSGCVLRWQWMCLHAADYYYYDFKIVAVCPGACKQTSANATCNIVVQLGRTLPLVGITMLTEGAVARFIQSRMRFRPAAAGCGYHAHLAVQIDVGSARGVCGVIH